MTTTKDPLLHNIDTLWRSDKPQEAFDEAMKVFAERRLAAGEKLEDPLTKDTAVDVDLLWRVARAHHDLCEENRSNAADKPKAKQFIEDAMTYIDVATAKDPLSTSAHQWRGTILAVRGNFLPMKEMVANAYTVRDALLKTLELDSENGIANLTMANWCLNVAQISWFQRKTATMLFGAPPTATLDECERYLNKACEKQECRDFVLTPLVQGDLCLAQNRKDEAKKWYEKASTFPTNTDYQKRHVEAAKWKFGRI